MSVPSPTIAELKSEAESLNIEDVAEYVLRQQQYYREERALERDRDREKAEERRLEREHELSMAQLNSPVVNRESHILSDISCRPKLPVYKDGEDISSYLVRFERIADLLHLDDDSLAVRLGSLLSGRAVTIYASLPPETTGDYDKLKKALLLAFNRTHESFRSEFRSAKLGANETYEQFSIQLGRTLDFWIQSCEIGNSYDELRNFILTDQVLASLSPELRLFIKERNVHTLKEVVKLADDWTAAHNAYPKKSKVNSVPPKVNQSHSGKPNDSKSTFGGHKQTGSQRDWSNVKCFLCGALGHPKYRCPQNPQASPKFNSGKGNGGYVNFCLDDQTCRNYLVAGTINGSHVSTILRDTGCNNVIVSEEVLPDIDVSSCKTVKVSDYLGREDSFPQVRCYLKCPYFCGWVDAIRAPIKFCSVLVGNVEGATEPVSNLEKSSVIKPTVLAVTTRSAERNKRVHPLILPELNPLQIKPEQFKVLQDQCSALEDIRTKCQSGDKVTMKDGSVYRYVRNNDLLYRSCISSKFPQNVGKHSLVVPVECRLTVLLTAHESPLAGHFSHRKTELRIKDTFFWPRMSSDIRNFCRSCERCQRVSSKGRVKNVPMVKMPIITEPFSRVAMDLVGPLTPPTSEGHRYILTLIDCASGFPEAIPLKEINSISVSEALLLIFSRVGIPKEILSDRGPQFTSQLMGELHRLLGVKPLFTTAYHPMCNGRIERVHSTLKACLKKLCVDKPKEWHRYLIPTLFAIREIPSDRSGFSPFELLYGRQVRGPLAVLRDLWEDSSLVEEERTIFQYVIELRDKLDECSQLAASAADLSSSKYKQYFDLKSQNRSFAVKDEILVLLPDSTNKLLMAWKGPFEVLERRNKVDYLINENGKPKLYHANLLKKYHRRANINCAYVLDEESSEHSTSGDPFLVCHNCVINCDEPVGLTESVDGKIPDIEDIQLFDGEEQPSISADLSSSHRSQILSITEEFQDVLSPLPGSTSTVMHDINLITSQPIRAKLYPVPLHLKPYFEGEVDKLLDLGVIEPSKSSFCSPVVLVKKPDLTYRLAIDFRALNAVTAFEAEPSCNIEEELPKFATARYFSELDLSKAYYQLHLTEKAKPLTAFATHRGLMQFNRMPFGLVTACATYVRLMRIVLANLNNVSFYFDNIFVYSDNIQDHLKSLNAVFEKLREHGLTARPSKCKFGFSKINYLGFQIGEGEIRPQNDKVSAIRAIPPPKNKKLLRSFLGMISFYRKFIENASSLTAPLTDMLRKGTKEPLCWTEQALVSFSSLKSLLSLDPVLKLPNPELPFIVRTDASNLGLGAVLMQYHGQIAHPVAYASRKLLDRERRYSTIERECLAVVYGVAKFNYFLLGREFNLEVDHRPLVYLNKLKGSNDRLMRWAISLQPYRFRIVYIPGKDNFGADLLSRSTN